MSTNSKTLKPAIGNKLQNNPFLAKDQPSSSPSSSSSSSSTTAANSSGMKKPIITGRKAATANHTPWLKSQEKEIPTFSKRASIQKISQKVSTNPWKQQQQPSIATIKKNSTSPIKNSTSPLPKQQQSTPLLISEESSPSSIPIETSAPTIVKKPSLDTEKSKSKIASPPSSPSSQKLHQGDTKMIKEKEKKDNHSLIEKQLSSSVNNTVEKKSNIPTKSYKVTLPSSINNSIKNNDKSFNMKTTVPAPSSAKKVNADSSLVNNSIPKSSLKKSTSLNSNSSIKKEEDDKLNTLKKEMDINKIDEQQQQQQQQKLITSSIRSLGYSTKNEKEFDQLFNDVTLPWQQHLESSSLSFHHQNDIVLTDYDTIFQQLIVSHAVASSLDFPTVQFDYAQSLQKDYSQDIKKNDIDMLGLRLLTETKAQRMINTMDKLSINQEEKEQNQLTLNDRMDKIDRLIHELMNYMNQIQLKREQYLQHLAGTLAKYCSIMTTTTTTTVTTTSKTMINKIDPSIFYQIKQDFIHLLHKHFPLVISSIPCTSSSSTSSTSSTFSLKQNNDSIHFSSSEHTSMTSLEDDDDERENYNSNNNEEEGEEDIRLRQKQCIMAKEEIHCLFKLLDDHLKNHSYNKNTTTEKSIDYKDDEDNGMKLEDLETQFKKTLEKEKQQYQKLMDQKKKELDDKELLLTQLKQETNEKQVLMDELNQDLKREQQKNQELLSEQQQHVQLKTMASSLSKKEMDNSNNDNQKNMDQLLIIINKEKQRNQQLEQVLNETKKEYQSKQEQIDHLTAELLEKKKLDQALDQYKMENASKQEHIDELMVQLEKEKKHSQQLEEQFIEACQQDKLRQADIQKLESQLEQTKQQHQDQQGLYEQHKQEWEQEKHKLNQLILDLEFKQQDQEVTIDQLKQDHHEKLAKAIQEEKLSYDGERQFYQDQIKQLEQQHQQLDKKHTQLFMEWEELKQQHDHVNGEYATLQQDKQQLEATNQQLKLSLDDQLIMMTEKENQLNQQQEDFRRQKSAYQQLEKDHEAYKKQAKEKDDRYLMDYYHHMKKKDGKKEGNDDTQSLATIDDILRELYNERNQLQNNISTFEKEKQMTTTQIDTLESQIEDYKEQVSQLKKDMEQYTTVDYKIKYEEMIHHLEEAQRQFTLRESGYLLQSASVEAELEQVLKEYDRLLGQFTDFNSERKKYEQQIQDILNHNLQLDKQVADLQVATLGINDGASTTMTLRKEFRQLMAQTKEKHQQQLEKELELRLNLENQCRNEKQELEFLKWDKVNVSVQTNFVYI
ncbi:unnamed protein product [Cunninghamella echinulata]